MAESPIDNQTRRTFDWTDVKRFAWDACREVVLNKSYREPWTFQDFLMVSKHKAYKSDNRITVDSFFNNNNIYRPFIEEIIKDLESWGFVSKKNNATEIEEAVYFPTMKIKDYAQIFEHFQDGEIDKVESYRIP